MPTYDASDTADDSLFLRDALDGLLQEPKMLPCIYLYDERGAELFDRICETKEYYPTRTEVGILRKALPKIAEMVGPGEVVIEPGAGSGLKTVMLIDALKEPASIVPIDISPEFVEMSCESLSKKFPQVEVHGLVADFTGPVSLPDVAGKEDRRLVFFPGSTIGNFTPEARVGLMDRFAELTGRGGRLLLGYDLLKSKETLLAAYNDSDGVTAAFNINLLERMNRELDAGFDMGAFSHDVVWNGDKQRIEMHLVSARRQTVSVGGQMIEFGPGETIHTENSHKFDPQEMRIELEGHGFEEEATWFDDQRHFAVSLLRHSYPGKRGED